MTKEKIEFANILCDYEVPEEVEKSLEVKRKLGDLGIHATTSDIDNDGLAPSTPWLEYEDTIYYSHQIDSLIERLNDERDDLIYRGHKFNIKICESLSSKYTDVETPRVKFTIQNVSSGKKFVAYRHLNITSPKDLQAIEQAHQAIDYYLSTTDE